MAPNRTFGQAVSTDDHDMDGLLRQNRGDANAAFISTLDCSVRSRVMAVGLLKVIRNRAEDIDLGAEASGARVGWHRAQGAVLPPARCPWLRAHNQALL